MAQSVTKKNCFLVKQSKKGPVILSIFKWLKFMIIETLSNMKRAVDLWANIIAMEKPS